MEFILEKAYKKMDVYNILIHFITFTGVVQVNIFTRNHGLSHENLEVPGKSPLNHPGETDKHSDISTPKNECYQKNECY